MDQQEGLSFVLFQDLSEKATCVWSTDSVRELLGWDPKELHDKSFYDIVHPEEEESAKRLHYDHVRDDKAATLTYMRLLHKGTGEYELYAFSRSVAYNFIVGSISLATDDQGKLNAATATGGVFVLTPTAHQLAFRRLSQRDMADKPIFTGSPNDYSVPINQLQQPSPRAALLLNRFKRNEAIVDHCSNNVIVPANHIIGKDLFSFIKEESGRKDLQAALNITKTLGVTQIETAKSDLYSFCKFTLLIPTSPEKRQNLEGIVSAHSDAILLLIVPLGPAEIISKQVAQEKVVPEKVQAADTLEVPHASSSQVSDPSGGHSKDSP